MAESEADRWRLFQACRAIVAGERLGLGDPRNLTAEQAEQVQSEIKRNGEAIEQEVARRWPEYTPPRGGAG